MELTIQSLHFTAKQELNNFIIEKLNKLSRFSHSIKSAEVWLKLEKSETTENKVCEIKLIVPGGELFAERKCATFEEAVVQTIDALEQQVRKLKTKFDNQ